MNTPEDVLYAIRQILKDFEDCNERLSGIDISKLPFEMQISMMAELTKLTAAMKNYNEVVKRAIVMDALLNQK